MYYYGAKNKAGKYSKHSSNTWKKNYTYINKVYLHNNWRSEKIINSYIHKPIMSILIYWVYIFIIKI